MLLNESQNPLVTLAVFSYNQEKFIREAIEGALSQDYTPLEIILSDDASSDATFEIVEKYAKEYRGPHSLKIRRNYINLGTAMHVSIVGQEAAGAFVVVAAGDDISTSCRVSKIVETWKQYPDAAVIHSGRSTMVPEGNLYRRIFCPLQNLSTAG